ncbi:hypothetical protein AAF712_010901 [Marasmius tenuissimus]|uniref:Uncharacterized protein n=1 Tax=Marasmius tenuissimus TaxID=585030 RepID=A0ABR2ZML3_9AGAR
MEDELKKLQKDLKRLRSVNIEIAEKWTNSQKSLKELQRKFDEDRLSDKRSRHRAAGEVPSFRRGFGGGEDFMILDHF